MYWTAMKSGGNGGFHLSFAIGHVASAVTVHSITFLAQTSPVADRKKSKAASDASLHEMANGVYITLHYY